MANLIFPRTGKILRVIRENFKCLFFDSNDFSLHLQYLVSVKNRVRMNFKVTDGSEVCNQKFTMLYNVHNDEIAI